jgi:hypothetical protein
MLDIPIFTDLLGLSQIATAHLAAKSGAGKAPHHKDGIKQI